MSILGRIFLAFYSLLFIALCAVLTGLLWNDSQMIDIELGDLNFQSFFVPGADNAQKWAFTGLMAAFCLFGLATLLLAFMRSSSSSGGRLRIRQSDGGTVEVEARAIEAIIIDEVERLPDVRQADAKVRINGNAVDPLLTLVVQPSTSIAHITSEAAQATARALREQVGVANIRRPTVKISYDEISARPVPGGRPRPQHPGTQPPPPAPLADTSQQGQVVRREPLFPTSQEGNEGAWGGGERSTGAPSSGTLEWREGDPSPGRAEDEQARNDDR